jgi:hypothetical protein
MIQGSLSTIEDSLPNGFHDAELVFIDVDWTAERATLRGSVDVSDVDAPAAYRPFLLVVDGIRSLALPLGCSPDQRETGLSLSLVGRGWCGGLQGWPPERAPADPPFPDAWVYSFFLHELNDFVTIQGRLAQFEWADKPKHAPDPERP